MPRSDSFIFVNSSPFCREALPPRDHSPGQGAKRRSLGGMRLAAKPNCDKATIANYSKVAKIKLSYRDNNLLSDTNLTG